MHGFMDASDIACLTSTVPQYREYRQHGIVGAQVAIRDVVRDSQADSHHASDAVILDSGELDTRHRNRFVSENRLALIAPDVSDVRTCLDYARKRLGKLVEFDEVVVELGRAKMRTVKCSHGGDELLKFISGNRAAKLFTVESASCSDRTAPPANTLRKLHGRSY
jgi:hypothetical protein